MAEHSTKPRGGQRYSRSQSKQEDRLQQQLNRKLPAMLSAALEAYERIVADPSDDPKQFASQQTAAKAALSHIEMVLKMVQTVGSHAQENRDAESDIDALVSAAREALNGPSRGAMED